MNPLPLYYIPSHSLQYNYYTHYFHNYQCACLDSSPPRKSPLQKSCIPLTLGYSFMWGTRTLNIITSQVQIKERNPKKMQPEPHSSSSSSPSLSSRPLAAAPIEEKLSLRIPIVVEESKQQPDNTWYFRSFTQRYFELTVRTAVIINTNRLLLTLAYGALALTMISRMALHMYMWRQNEEVFAQMDEVTFVVELAVSLLWLCYFIYVYIRKLRFVYMENVELASSMYIVFCLMYYFLSFLSAEIACELLPDYTAAVVTLHLLYGFLAEKSPNSNAFACCILFVIFIGELIVRTVTCKLGNLFAKSRSQGFKQVDLSLFRYAAEFYELKTCSICLGDFAAGETVCPLGCHRTHIFHSECLKQWLFKNCCCPNCRTPLSAMASH